MKTILKSVLTLGLAAGLGFVANAQTNESAQVTASAQILSALDIAKVTDVNFGTLSRTTLGVVTLSPIGSADNAYVGTGAVTGKLTIKGEEATSIFITYPAEIELTNGTDDLFWDLDITANNIEDDQSASSPLAAGGASITTAATAVSDVVLWLYVGGKLYQTTGTPAALSAAPTGTFTGTATIEVEYN